MTKKLQINFEIVGGKYYATSSSGIGAIGYNPENFAYFIRDEAGTDNVLTLTYTVGLSSKLDKKV